MTNLKSKPGSQLYALIQAHDKTAQALNEIEGVISSLKAKKADDRAELAALDWTAKLDNVVKIQQRLSAYDTLINLAEVERAKRVEVRRAANLPIHKIESAIQQQQLIVRQKTEWLDIHRDNDFYLQQVPHVELDIKLANEKLNKLISQYCE